jgi:uncharacterized SAM-dependent methyltransferase
MVNCDGINEPGIKTVPKENRAGNTQQFYNDVMEGLSQFPKRLPSKYFYDAVGDKLFQQIMHSPDYYVTRCELIIFNGFKPVGNLMDSKRWFVDACWEVVV